MKLCYILLLAISFSIYLYPQVPIQYYDFENNTTRTTDEITPEIIINSVSGSSLTSNGGSLSGVAGNPSSGSAQQRGSWDGNGASEPEDLNDYIQFSVNAAGFSNISVTVDAQVSVVLVLGRVNLRYSTDGNNFSTASEQSFSSVSFEEKTWNLSGEALGNNTITFRIYVFGDASGTQTLTIDNLTVYATKVTATKTLGNYQLIANAIGSFPVFNDFEIDGSGIQVSLASNLRLDGTLRLTNGLILTDINRIIMEMSATVTGSIQASYVVGSFAYYYPSGDHTKTFPLGALTGPHPVTLGAFGMVGSGEITITEIDEGPGSSSLSGIDRISIVRYWNLTTENTITDLNHILLRLVWGSDDGVTDPNNLTIVYSSNKEDWFGNAADNLSTMDSYVQENFDPAQSGQSGYYTFGNITDGTNPLPVELSTFNFKVLGTGVHLFWRTETEVNSYSFEIERLHNKEWQKTGEVKAHGNTNSQQNYSFTDKDLLAGNYWYRLKMIDNDGSFDYSPELNVKIENPDNFKLHQNYPNPFNPSTTIAYSLPNKSLVSLKVFNLLGKEITTLVNEEQPAGEYRVNFDASKLAELPSGIYIYILKAGTYKETKKMIFMK